MAETIQFEQVMENLACTLPSLYAIATVFFIVGGLWLTFFAILDLAQLSESRRKYLGTQQPSGAGVIIKLFVAGLMLNFALSGQTANVISSMFFSDNSYQLITIESYVSDPEESAVQRLTRITLFGFMQVVGIIAIFKGLRVFAKISDRSSQESGWHGAAYLIYGTLCMQFAKVLSVIENTIGFSVFSILGIK